MYEGTTYKYLAYNYQCVGDNFIFGNSFTLKTQIIVYICVGIDVFIIICFLFFLISEHKAERDEIKQFKAKELAVHDFSVKISGFHQDKYEE